jgi:hypothetical protein
MEDRASKLRRLNEFRRRRPHVTASALAETLRGVQEEGLPPLHTRNQLRESRDLICTEKTPFGPIVQAITVVDNQDRPKRIAIASPFALLYTAINTSVALANLFESRLDVCPSSPETPWNMILYSDEITPGNPLQTKNKRKFQGVYFTFLEFGPHALSREETWFPLMTEYSLVVNNVQATMSQVFSEIIKFCFQTDGLIFLTGGISLPIRGGTRFWAKLGIFLQDGAAQTMTWSARAGACRLCLLCNNIFTEQSQVVDADGSHLLRCNVVKEENCELSTDDGLRNVARYLEGKAGTMLPSHFDDLQKALGLTHRPYSLLLDRNLDSIVKPTEQYMHDWMHTLFADGIANLNVYLLFEAFFSEDRRQVYELFRGFAKRWIWPRKHYSAHLPDIFAADRTESQRKAKHIKCQASDMMSLLPVLAYFVHSVLMPTGLCAEACQTFLAMCDMCDFITSVNRGRITPSMIRKSVERFMQLFLLTFGAAWMTPKMHWLLHMSRAYSKWGVLLACFVNERYHRFPKQYATDLKNTSHNGGLSLLKEVICHTLSNLSAPKALDFSIGPIHPRTAKKKEFSLLAEALELDEATLRHVDVQVSIDARFNDFGMCFTSDVVLIKSQEGFVAAQIVLHASVDGDALSLVNEFKLKSLSRAAGYSEWEVGHAPLIILTRDILDTVLYSKLANDVYAVLLPCEFR